VKRVCTLKSRWSWRSVVSFCAGGYLTHRGIGRPAPPNQSDFRKTPERLVRGQQEPQVRAARLQRRWFIVQKKKHKGRREAGLFISFDQRRISTAFTLTPTLVLSVRRDGPGHPHLKANSSGPTFTNVIVGIVGCGRCRRNKAQPGCERCWCRNGRTETSTLSLGADQNIAAGERLLPGLSTNRVTRAMVPAVEREMRHRSAGVHQ